VDFLLHYFGVTVKKTAVKNHDEARRRIQFVGHPSVGYGAPLTRRA
jgi:hypothetical protein